ncbi:SPOR domain-containing protein [Cereibacter johrii]|uniref:Sporulation related protein n=1 Tax=Cereibacter johrii TaxID=445629 RepID=A0ABX5J9G0_9RHOB|nr:SPOR domain-containing protein [Cereibacter johrii]ODM43745.1 sporulation protein [Cereibacter johrii]PTM79014.1 sporulation related protein [Cereibacter johrii]
MSHPIFRNWALVAAAGLVLGACDRVREATGFGPSEEGAAEAVVPAQAPVGADVEAPEAYQTTDKALWDGRPSLGGIWVAAPDVKDPERVVMVNPANGRSVVGALFRRERENPGPKLQLSSDAAEALGLLAGQPATIRVTALRRKEAADAAPAGAPAGQPDPQPAAEAGPAFLATEAPAASPAPVAGGRTIRVGSFGQSENARRTADRLTEGGVPARVAEVRQDGKSLWTVLAGPAPSDEAPALLARVKGLGFADAYLLAR